MGPHIGRYLSEREGRRPEPRVLVDVSRAHAWVLFLGAVLGLFISAAGGVIGAAHWLVPPIARDAVRPDIERVEKLQEKFVAEEKAADQAIIADMKAADQLNLVLLRQDIQDVRTAAIQVDKTMKDLLIQLAIIRGRPVNGPR